MRLHLMTNRSLVKELFRDWFADRMRHDGGKAADKDAHKVRRGQRCVVMTLIELGRGSMRTKIALIVYRGFFRLQLTDCKQHMTCCLLSRLRRC